MTSRLKIYTKNNIREAFFRIYRIYKTHLENKIPVFYFHAIDVIRQLPEDAVCIDVGAGEGQLLRYMYKQCRKGHIIGVEPVPELVKSLLATYNKSRVTIKQIVLFDKIDELDIYYFKKQRGIQGLRSKSFIEARELYRPPIKVLALPLDQFFDKDRLDFMMINAGAAVLNVLKGAYQTLERFHPTIVFTLDKEEMEYLGQHPTDLWQLLDSVGYQIAALEDFLNKKPPLEQEAFVKNLLIGYDCNFIAY